MNDLNVMQLPLSKYKHIHTHAQLKIDVSLLVLIVEMSTFHQIIFLESLLVFSVPVRELSSMQVADKCIIYPYVLKRDTRHTQTGFVFISWVQQDYLAIQLLH